KLRPRARLPETGSFEHLSRFDVRWGAIPRTVTTYLPDSHGWERKPTQEELTTMKYEKGDLGPWLDVKNAEVQIFHQWNDSLVGLKSLDDETQEVIFSDPAIYPVGSFPRIPITKTYLVWNVREGMHKPGQWYLDMTEGKLVYWPLSGEDISKIRAVVPTTENVIRLENDTNDILIKGLVISCTKSSVESYSPDIFVMNGAISGNGINNCRFIDLTVEYAGGWGFRINGNNIRIEGCEIKETGTSGIGWGGQNVIITNNHVHDVGKIHFSAIGISGGGKDSEISHNEIHAVPYSAVTCIGGKNNIFEGNLFYDYMQILTDGAAIYVGWCNNIIMRGNIARGNPDRIYVQAYYFDAEVESGIIEKNLAINSAWPICLHVIKNCIIRNNVFIDEGSQTLRFLRSVGTIFENNIIIADEITFKAPIPGFFDHQMGWQYDGIGAMPNNILFSRSNKIINTYLEKYSDTRTFPLEPIQGTVFADPKFVDWENGNFNFKPDSPALKMGIEPIDMSKAGRKDLKK
ncbi:MAG TPA: right-handed parallel beta-helix repeat-containing protein, partial [bacterium]|nr:right-handed parallel beta-helix repeat-containing protein [bacterium]